MAPRHYGELDTSTFQYWLADDVQVLWGIVMYVALLCHTCSVVLISSRTLMGLVKT